MLLKPIAFLVATCSIGATRANNADIYTPVKGFDANRMTFYKHERNMATQLNPNIRNHPNSLRIAHFDAHWHGMTISEYIDLQRATSAHILVARGVPEREGYAETIKRRIVQAGFDDTSLVESPCAALTSGMLVGVSRGINIRDSHFVEWDGKNVALEAEIVIGNYEPLTLVVLSLDALDETLRIRQLNAINSRLHFLQSAKRDFLVLGGLHADVRSSAESRVLLSSAVTARDAFFVVSRLAPSYTSWWGKYTDTVWVAEGLMSSIIDTQVFHAEVDCLPVLVDFDMKAAHAVAVGNGEGTFSGSGFSVPRWMKKYWKPALLFLAALIIACAAAVLLAKRLPRNDSSKLSRGRSRPIQPTKYVDSDIKIKSSTKTVAYTEPTDQNEVYPDEKN